MPVGVMWSSLKKMCMDPKDLEEACPTVCSNMHSFLRGALPIGLFKKRKIWSEVAWDKKKSYIAILNQSHVKTRR